MDTNKASAKNLPLPAVSIVVPVYGVEKYVGRCFDSVAAQTYPNLECVFVDDRGPDASMDVLRERIAAYRGNVRFRVVRHERNRGLSAARNTGADAATGEYVYFLDSDDLLTPDCVALLAEPLRERRVDFVLGNYASGGDRSCFIPVKAADGFIRGNAEIRARYLRGEWFMMAWNRLVKREFLVRENLRFAEGLLHEDNLWSFQLACGAESMCVVRAPTYVYTIRGNSIMTAKSRKNLDSLVRIADEMDAFARERADAAGRNFVLKEPFPSRERRRECLRPQKRVKKVFFSGGSIGRFRNLLLRKFSLEGFRQAASKRSVEPCRFSPKAFPREARFRAKERTRDSTRPRSRRQQMKSVKFSGVTTVKVASG